jgi:preprotein translocase subunit YajC
LILYAWSDVVVPALVQLLVLLAAVLLFWAIVMRPARNQQRAVHRLQSELAVGDEVVISAGIFGVVRSIDDARVELEIAPDIVVTVARQVVVRRVDEADQHTSQDTAEDADQDADQDSDQDSGRQPVGSDDKESE